MLAIEFIKIGTQLDIFFEETIEINKCYTTTVISINKIQTDPDLGKCLNCVVKCEEDDEEVIVNLYENDFENEDSEDRWSFTDFYISKLIKESVNTLDTFNELTFDINQTKNATIYVNAGTVLLIGIAIFINFYVL